MWCRETSPIARALDALVEGAEAVIHVAAVYRTAGHADEYYRDVNVGGTERLLEAAAHAGVARFVHTSTVGVHGDVAIRRLTKRRRSLRATCTRRPRPRRSASRSTSIGGARCR